MRPGPLRTKLLVMVIECEQAADKATTRRLTVMKKRAIGR
jgi:hypothetical protein